MASMYLRVIVTALLVSVTLSVDARMVVRMVQMVHHHGAYNPLMWDSKTENCLTLHQCGELTDVGIAMARAIGIFSRSRYNNLSLVESPLFPSRQSSSSAVYTRSTLAQRTVQTATAFLRGSSRTTSSTRWSTRRI